MGKYSFKEILILILAVAFGLFFTGLLFTQIRQKVYYSGKEEFARQVEKIKRGIHERFEKYEGVLEGARAFLYSSDQVTPSEWDQYVRSINLKGRYPGFLGLGFARHVPMDEKNQFLKWAEEHIDKEYQIWPESSKSSYLPVVMRSPLTKNKVIGFDLFIDRKRYNAAQRAITTNSPTLTGSIKLVQFDQTGPAFYFMIPVYRKKALNGFQIDQEDVLGIVYAPLKMRELVEGVLGEEEASYMDLKIYDGPKMSPKNLLFRSEHDFSQDERLKASYEESGVIQVPGREWTLHIRSLPAYDKFIQWRFPWMIFSIGSLATLFFVAWVKSLLSTRKQSREIVTKKTEELEKSLAHRQAILDSSSCGIIFIDSEGKIQNLNKASEKMLNLEEYKACGKPIHHYISEAELLLRAKSLSKQVNREVQANFDALSILAKKGITDEKEWTLIREDKTSLPVQLSLTSIQDSFGNVLGYVGVAFDITERKKIERLKNEFISTVSHELRTPLTSIKGSLSLISSGKVAVLPDKVQKLIEIAEANCDRLVKLVCDILDIEKMESGHMAFNFKNIDLLSVIDSSIEANRSFAAKYHVTLSVDAPKKVEFIVKGDEDSLIRVMNNLITNAVKYSPINGQVKLSVFAEEGKVLVHIQDHGPGIPSEFLGRIFQKFSQADSSNARKKEGSGLGLNISKKIIESHSGSISFKTGSEGTTFIFELPLVAKIDL